jgi:tetratricopeptide (TPR) repeat protein
VIKLQPEKAEAHFDLGRYYHETLKYDEALASYREALRLKLDDPSRAHAEIGRIFKKQGKLDEAALAFGEAIQLKPNDGDLHDELGGVFFDKKDYEACQVERLEAIRLKPDEAQFRANLGWLLMDWGKNIEAEAEFRKGIERFPEYATLHYNLGRALRNQNRRDEAIAAFREGNRLDAKEKKVGWSGKYLVDNLNQVGRHDEALAASWEMVRLKPGLAWAHEKFADSLRAKGILDQAIEEYRRAIELDPGSLSCCRDLVNLLAHQGRWAEAMVPLARAVELDPSNPNLWLQMGTLYLQVEDSAGYRRHSIAMLDRFGETPESGYAGKCCVLSDRPVELDRAFKAAELSYNLAVKKNPKSGNQGWPQLDLALAEYRRGHYQRASDLLSKCLPGANGNFKVEVQIVLAMAYQRLGHKLEARQLLSESSKSLRSIGTKQFEQGVYWLDWLMNDLLRREAEALIRLAESPTPPSTLTNSFHMEFRLIPAGDSLMGSPAVDPQGPASGFRLALDPTPRRRLHRWHDRYNHVNNIKLII